MNFKHTRQDVDKVCFMLKKHVKTHAGLMFCKPPKTTLQICMLKKCVKSHSRQMICRPPKP